MSTIKQLIDHHVHSNYSPDSNTSMEQMIDRCKTLGGKGIMFTDHVDYDYPDPLFKDHEINYNKYTEQIKSLKEQHNIDIQMGVEIGYQNHLNDKLNQFLKKHPFDFVICSLHMCNKLDFYNGDFFKNKTKKDSYMEYLQAVKKAVLMYDNYDVYGHLDYLVRYAPYKRNELEIEEFREAFDEILKLIIEKGKGIEINTSGIRYGLDAMHPNRSIIKRYRKLGGEIITIGSDAHIATDLYSNFDDAIELLKELGFKAVAQFKNRKVSFVDLK
ncbi:histidinol-phosphatase HisJ family protein [Haloplasma contractile]|uniref:Histidinol-phosphatase n=1 Tax=Haloplasma contractile SSD-17B TaxID=1033810 RepID=U2EAV7_9MOLU|nr:histidinol-phosphatase HisJ family protein [Haloplasma contractile]ERJ11941.1 putative histidinol-phosphatase protein [Haloplasma contractile SSD-17B]